MQDTITARALSDADDMLKQRDDLMAKVSGLENDLDGFSDLKEFSRKLEVADN